MAERLRDHWAATDANWNGDTPRLQWHATLRNAPALTRFVERLRPALECAYLVPVDARWLHLTVHDVGVLPDGRRDVLERLVTTAGELCRSLPPMRLRLERPRLARTAVVLDAAPPEPIWRLRELLRTADLQVRDTGATPLPAGPASPPHVSVAYARRAANAGALAATLEALAPGPIELDVRDVDLLRLRRDYTWETLATVELCGEPARQ